MNRQNFHYNAEQLASNQAAMMEHDAAALAAEMFDHFSSAMTMRQILGLYRNMCDTIGLRPGPLNEFYPKLKAKIKNWKAQALWKKFDARLMHRVYNKGTACSGTRVLIIGGGPCGLRTAIEAQLLGAKVVVVEKRDRMSRNNVLHLWPFLIHDLRSLGAKKFYGKFCAGSIDHISIRQLQCILMKVALLLGVEFHEGVGFERLIEPSDGCGWRALVDPPNHAVSHFEFDALIGADGKRNTLEGFKRKEFRGKLAIAITANFINKRTEEEARVQEISGVAFIFNQSFFKELYHQTGIDLENIVYYKDETHYFVMTAKKHSLLDKGVIIQDCSDPAELLHPNNVNTQKLQDYAREAADFSTKYQMPNLEFAVNHYGKPDVAMFDFTSMFAAENSSRIIVKKNYRLLSCLVGDSLLEPFWPSGSGCARGFLSGMDAAYAIKLLSNPNNSSLAVLAQRESIYRLLAQTTPENLHRDHGGYTLDPVTRYPNLNRQSVIPHQVKHLLDTDDPSLLEQTFMDTSAIQTLPDPVLKTRKRRTTDATPMANILLGWIKSHLKDQDFVTSITEPSQCFTHGKVLCALINRYRPDLVDWTSIQECSAEEANETAFRIFEKEFNIQRVMTSEESLTLDGIDIKNWLHYLEQICEVFRGEIPHVKHPKLDYNEFKQKNQTANTMADFARLHRIAAAKREAAKDENGASHVSAGGRRLQKLSVADKLPTSPSPQNVDHRRGRKRRSYEKYTNIEERMARLADIDANRVDRQARRRQQRRLQTENFLKSLHMLQANNYLRDSEDSAAFEDYSIFMYRQNAPEFNSRVKELERKLLYPDRERGIPSATPRAGGAIDDQFSDRIRHIEEKFTTKNAAALNKKPKDLLRAIGKIETNDWNVKEIEKKMEMSKKVTDIGKSREKVPKWSREQFVARQNKMSKPERQDSSEQKYKEIDNTLKALDKQLKEGSVLDRGERGKNKVASLAGTFGRKKEEENSQAAQKAGLILTSQSVSEACHFCKQRVYLMEKISAESLTLHRSCLKCHHCHTSLRLGGYAFDRESPDGKFYCTQHYKLPPKDVKFVPKRLQHKHRQQEYAAFKAQKQQDASKKGVEAGDAMDNRGKTPERIEFENADGVSDEPVEDQIMDENEWTDVNFRTGSEDDDDDSSSDESDTDSDSEMFEDPVGVDAQTLQLASEWIDKRSTLQDSEDEFYGYSSEDDDADSQTEGEELAKAREMRMNEVKLQPLPYVQTDTETEGVKMARNNNEIDNFNPKNNLISGSSVSFTPNVPSFSKDELLKSEMMKKLSLKEKWLNEQASLKSKAVPMEVDQSPIETTKKKDEKKSFLTGIFSSVKHLIKPEKDKAKKSKSPGSGESVDLDKLIENEKIDIDNFDELVVESDKPTPGCVNQRIQAFLQKQKSEEIREGADDILNNIKEGNDKMAKQMRDMEQKRFSDNMQAIKSSVVDSKVSSMKEVNLSKYFPSAQDKKPPAVAKNRDVKALKDVNLSKYFPSSPTPGRKISGSPNAQSTTSSAAASPLMPRKNINEIDLANYFPGTPVLTRKSSISTPPGSPMTETPSFERRFSITNSIPPPPPPPVPKRNILANQTVKKRAPTKENVDANVQVSKGTPTASQLKKPSKKNDFNMFDQLLDGAIDLKTIEEKVDLDLENFESLIDEVKLDRSPSKEYEKIFENSKTTKTIGDSPELDETVQETKKVIKKPKRKSPKKIEKNEMLDKFAIDPKIFQSLTKEYQRLVVEHERTSRTPESEEVKQRKMSPVQAKRKSPQRFEDRKKFKEELEVLEVAVAEEPLAEEDSVVARLERKYGRRGSLKVSEEISKENEAVPKPEPVLEELQVESPEPTSVLERLQKKLKKRRELEMMPPTSELPDVIKEPPKLMSASLVSEQLKKQEVEKAVEKPKRKLKAETTPKQEINFFETLLSLPKENINDIFSEFEMTNREAENNIQESFEKLAEVEAPNVLKSFLSLPKENDFDFDYKTIAQSAPEGKSAQAKTIDSNLIDQRHDRKREVASVKIENNQKPERKSLQLDLAEIDFGISERPLNIENIFARQISIEEIPDSPKSLNSNDDIKVTDSAYSGSRKSSADMLEKEINEITSQPKIASRSYLNVLKEITSGLIGVEDEQLIFIEPQIKVEPKKAEVKTEAVKETAKCNRTKVLQDTQEAKEKNYSQLIPPFVQDPLPIHKTLSTGTLETSIGDKIRDFNSFSDLEAPLASCRRHKSVESNDVPEFSIRKKPMLPSSKSFDYDTISGRTSKNSTEYYDHYYPTAATSRRLEKYEPIRKESIDGGVRTRNRQRAIDDLMVKSTQTRLYEPEEVPMRRQVERRQSSEPSDANKLSEKSHMLHKRKESFMRDQMNDSNNPYIREMMKQDVDNPIDISDIKFIRQHPSSCLPSATHSYQRPSSYVPRTTTTNYGKPHTPLTTSTYSRSSAINPVSSYKSSGASSSLGYLTPSSSTAAKILTKSHTMSPHSSLSTSYTARSRPVSSLIDPVSSRHSRPSTYSHNKSSGSTRDACAQTDSDSSDEALNSATEISTDSEFDQDPVNRDPPKIFIDDSHLRKHPTRVQSKFNGRGSSSSKQQHQDIHLKFKPLVEVDPTIVKREPLKNPLPGNYLLSKTASTEGIASKKSLELKKRYLLGEAGNANAVLKSDSASALDTKLKSFHSNISECQKLLNPAAEISPSMQTFLQRIDRNNELNRSQHSIVVNKLNKDQFNNNQEEKENRSLDSNKKLEYSETVNTTLIENKIREMSPDIPIVPEIIEIIDLVTPEKNQPIIDLDQVEIPISTIDENKQFIENMEKSTTAQDANLKIKCKLDSMFIDLTVDSPPKERQTSETNNNTAPIPDIISNLTTKSNKDDENVERPRSPAHETTIEVPQIWAKTPKEVDTDSLSNESSTSSLEDIPHFILDSTTSPETHNDNVSFQAQPPRLEVRDSSGELMQIDSLMIIDGQYVGDPDDLPLFKEKPETPKPTLLKFDSRNENKLESLKNLPLIVPKEDPESAKKMQLRFNDKKSPATTPDGDKTPLADQQMIHHSDSETEVTGLGLTETELSDWTIDDALSENFVDVEFALNSGKGTIKKNKKLRSRTNGSNSSKASTKKAETSDVECGILKNLAIGEIDFMDTGSEDSCVETLSATNRAMLKNRGYVKFIDHQHQMNRQATYNAYDHHRVKERSPPVVEAINMEIVNVDFIEQGACILNNELKTPVNEEPLDSLNASCDDIDDDSLVVTEDKNQVESLPTVTTTTDTTEDLTIVTSPDSIPVNPKTPVNTTTSSTVITSESTPYERNNEPTFERTGERASSASRVSREQIDEMGGYEEYVKSLQMKIAQISNGRESLEKKNRRKLSKSDLLGDDSKADANKSLFSTPPPQTLSMKLEELTKERTKQKDIIHDLVMDKLQAKKQLNAEKRLNRSRNRNIFMESGAASFPLSPAKVPEALPAEVPKNVITYRESVNSLNQIDERKHSANSIFSGEKFAEPRKINKTQSFCYQTKQIPLKSEDSSFKAPLPPPRNRVDSTSDLTNTAEKMREDARARARLKSNEDLGLSPEEKILMLRRRYNLMQHTDMQPTSTLFSNDQNKCDDIKFREKKLSASKSFNDISRMNRHSTDISDGLRKHSIDFFSDTNLNDAAGDHQSPKITKESPKTTKSQRRDSERRKSLIQTVSDFFHKKKDQSASNKDLTSSPTSASKDRLSETSSTTSMFSRFRLSPKSKDSSKDKAKEKEATPPYVGERSKSVSCLKNQQNSLAEREEPPPIPPLPLNYHRSDDEGSFQTNENKNELKKLRAMSKASKQAELKRLRIAQEIKREQDEIDLKIKDLETLGVELEKTLRGEGQNMDLLNESSLSSIGSSDEDLLKELLDVWRNITQLKKRDEELNIRQQELQLEHRHAQLKEELSVRLSCSKLDKSAQDVAAEGAILSEMLEIVAKRAALRPSEASTSLQSEPVSLPVLPPQTTINPLMQQFSAPRFHPNNVHTFSSQSHNQEHDT